MSRIIITDEAERLSLAPDTQKARIVRKEVLEAKAEAEAIVKNAHHQARLLEEQARARMTTLEQTLEREAKEREAARLTAALLELEHERSKLQAQAETKSVELAVLLAERLVGEALTLEPTVIATLAAQTLTQARGSANVTLACHQEDRAALETLLTAYPSVRLEVDESLSRGDLRLVTNLGVIDAAVRPQLTHLARALNRAL